MSKKPFNYWQDHSANYLIMANQFEKRKPMDSPDGHGKKTGDCGDSVEFFLRVNQGILEDICFDIDGCKNTNACANTVIHLAEGETIDEAWNLTPEDVINYLETLPEDSRHCAELSMGAFYLALSSLKNNKPG
ncbi:MAG: iron-sulfur cluster assembly scaffold protein [Desulfobacterales bacterium]|nr:iron-sulfur cluster assembly scaffold protein [Desulfobacterales bacterium]MDD4070985.1 iron-sulfur cluster assembly scaffold protein [Desulfobacterales bacterium]MDD4391898.1 iron-sulfur cluster assembly scaffold protein [Desulfobacterales bacterium]